MKKTLLTLIAFSSIIVYSQTNISGQSDEYSFKYNPVYERGLPPSLFIDMFFADENENGILESNESAILKIQITNKGFGKAQGLKIVINDSLSDDNFTIGDVPDIFFILPQKTEVITLPIKAGAKVKTAEHKLKISVSEHFGYDMDPAFLVLNTLEYQPPQIVFSGFKIIDQGEGTGAIIEDGQLQAGEMVNLVFFVQNIGLGKANNCSYELTTTDENIFIETKGKKLNDFEIGEIKEISVKLSPNKRVDYKNELPIFLTIVNDDSAGNLINHQIPILLNKKPAFEQTLAVKADIEKLTKLVARFESTSDKFTTNIGTVKDITFIEPTKVIRTNAVAVVFGIENYKNLPPAPYAVNDAEIIKKYLKDRFGIQKVVIYKNEEVSGFIFDDIFNPENGELQKAIVKGETDLFVFYSGHGIPSKDGSNVYLFPSDGKLDRIEAQGYNLNDLYANLDKLGAKSVTLFIDACFSGASRNSEKNQIENLVAAKGVRIVPKLLQPWQTNPNFSIFNSSGPGETSLGFDPSKTGLFTYFLCVGLQGDADENSDHKITNGELSRYISSKVTETSKKIYGLQTPQFNGNENTIIIDY